ncbi:NAD(P)/FAD-dependent oxidoreductase, partial [Klebsiella pneumoniae]|nr:NAD(P)/FAD-dependent oxidoreductase [Klebsiella pneumoniae]
NIEHDGGRYLVETAGRSMDCISLVIATGGLSIPKIGASPFGYGIAERFGLGIVPPRAGLVPLTFDPELLEQTRDLSGV